MISHAQSVMKRQYQHRTMNHSLVELLLLFNDPTHGCMVGTSSGHTAQCIMLGIVRSHSLHECGNAARVRPTAAYSNSYYSNVDDVPSSAFRKRMLFCNENR